MKINNNTSIKLDYSTLVYSEPKPITVNSILIYNPDLYKDSTGSFFDYSSVGGNTGTIDGNAIQTVVSYEPPLIKFNGSDNRVYTATSYANPQVFSLSFWYRTAFKNGKKIIGFENTQNNASATSYDRNCYVGTNGYLYFGVNDSGTTKYATYSVDTSDYMWRHVVATYSNITQELRLYINGNLQSTTTGVAGAQNYTGWWRIGSYSQAGWTNGADGNFNGQISFPSVYNRLLSIDEIKQQFNSKNYLFASKQAKLGYIGYLQDFIVPPNVYKIDVMLAGAKGGDSPKGQTGGLGGNIFTQLSVTPGQVLKVVVGGYPGTSATPLYGGGGTAGTSGSGNFGAGGAGGGYTGIFNSSTLSQGNCIAIAGGGGGAAGVDPAQGTYTGGYGANNSSNNGNGQNGLEPSSAISAYGTNYGRGATQSAGGVAGTAFDTNSIAPTAGSALQGGNGGIAQLASHGGGAGGGGGYYGGGGSAAGGNAQGGGGGGSSYTPSYAYYGTGNSGHGFATISWYNQESSTYNPGFRYYMWKVLATRSAGTGAQASEFIFTDNGSYQKQEIIAVTNPGGSNTPTAAEGCDNLVDWNFGTKWLDSNMAGNNYSNVIFDFGSQQKRRYGGYTWATANDFSSRDPIRWALMGSHDNVDYYVLDVQPNPSITTSRNVWLDANYPINGNFNLVKFDYTGSEQSWVCPDGITSIWVLAAGANGGTGDGGSGRPGGNGAVIYTKVNVVAGTTYKVVVGGDPGTSQTAVYGYAGDGGTATDIGAAGGGLTGMFVSSVTSANAVVVAGGGGGGGGHPTVSDGGDAGALNTGAGSRGQSSGSYPNVPGFGGTQSGAGNAGTPLDTNSVNPTNGNDISGGNGGSSATTNFNGGGGGGAGYYGGGGGAAGGDATGGGGGGASYSNSTVIYTSTNTGDGYLLIQY
jgi:hypothetical protein